VDDADSPLQRQGDGKPGFGHRVHGRRDQGNAHADLTGQLGAEIHVLRQNRRMGRNEQYIVEGQGFLEQAHDHVP